MAKKTMRTSRNGGLTLVPMPGFVGIALKIKKIFQDRYPDTPIDIAVPEFGNRSSGEPFVKLTKDHVGGHDCVILTSGPGTHTMLNQTYMALGYLAGRRAGRISLVSGYMPLTRSDKDEGEEELALIAMVVHLLEAAAYFRLDRIITVDLHAEQEVIAGSRPGLITQVSMARRLLTQAIKDALARNLQKVCVSFPDEGAVKRFEAALNQTANDLQMEIPVVFGQKRRKNSRASKLLGLVGDVDALNGAIVFGFDDEIATFSSNTKTAEAIRSVYDIVEYISVVVHGVFSGPAPVILAKADCPVNRAYITDTILPYQRPELEGVIADGRLQVVSWCDDLAKIIFYHHWDMSIRSIR